RRFPLGPEGARGRVRLGRGGVDPLLGQPEGPHHRGHDGADHALQLRHGVRREGADLRRPRSALESRTQMACLISLTKAALGAAPMRRKVSLPSLTMTKVGMAVTPNAAAVSPDWSTSTLTTFSLPA